MKTTLLSPRVMVPDSTVDLLLDCHARIRRHAAASLELLTADVSPERIAQTAEALTSYFGRALPLHAKDEDLSVRPRMIAAGLCVAEVRAISREHEDMHDLLDRLLVRWAAIAEAPALRDAYVGKLAPITRELLAMLDEHLRIEEEQVFPALRGLVTPREDHAIVREMRARRALEET